MARPRPAMLLLAGLLLLTAAAEARTRVVVLKFGGGARGRAARRALVRQLKGSYAVLPGSRLLRACDELGIRFSMGANLAKAASHVGAAAVIGGKVGGSRLRLAVFSGRTGDVLASGAVPWGRRPSKKSVRRARALVLPALRKAARQRPRAESPPPDRGPEGPMTFSPEPVRRTDGAAATPRPSEPPPQSPATGTDPGTLRFEPEPVQQTAQGGAAAGGQGLSYEPPGGGAPAAAPPDSSLSSDASPEDDRPPRLAGTLGLGLWTRTFSLSDPSPGRIHGEYDAGAVFSLGLELLARPLAFFAEDWPANFWTRMRLQASLGLSSEIQAIDASFSTTMIEFIFDLGYRWNVLDEDASPLVDFGLGFGLLDFTVDWESATPQLPDMGYRFMLLGLGVDYPFIRGLGGESFADSVLRTLSAEMRFDYRIVFGTGGVEDDRWYGASSAGGISLSLGLNWSYGRFVARLAYGYTRYFLSFDEGNYAARIANDQLAAGGAVDQMHSLLFSGGYSY